MKRTYLLIMLVSFVLISCNYDKSKYVYSCTPYELGVGCATNALNKYKQNECTDFLVCLGKTYEEYLIITKARGFDSKEMADFEKGIEDKLNEEDAKSTSEISDENEEDTIWTSEINEENEEDFHLFSDEEE